MPETPAKTTSAPRTFAEQELALITVVLKARGWTVTDARQDGDQLTLFAQRRVAANLLTVDDLTPRA